MAQESGWMTGARVAGTLVATFLLFAAGKAALDNTTGQDPTWRTRMADKCAHDLRNPPVSYPSQARSAAVTRADLVITDMDVAACVDKEAGHLVGVRNGFAAAVGLAGLFLICRNVPSLWRRFRRRSAPTSQPS